MAPKAEKKEVAKELAPLGSTPRFSVTLFYYAVVTDVDGENAKRFPGQQTVSADTPEEFMELIGAFYGSLVEDSGSFVTYEPREIGPQGRSSPAAPAAAPTAAAAAALLSAPEPSTPNCPFHNKPISVKMNRANGQKFASCSERNADGGYCNWKPAE